MNNSDFLISVVIPVYKAEGIIPELVRRIEENLKLITDDYEMILVDDCSPDKGWIEILSESQKNPSIKALQLSRNFGQHFAITAGLDYAKGDWVIVMDCDLQDRPEEIINLYKKANDGFDIVLAKRFQRTDGFLKKLSSKMFYKTLSYLTDSIQDSSVANFGIYNSAVINSIKKLREPIRYFPTMVRWVGFNSTSIEVFHGERFSGKTSYNWKKLIKLAIDIILANSDKPIRILAKFGLSVSLLSLFVGIYIFIEYLKGSINVPGYPSLLISIWFIGGMILFVLGMIGLYIGKIFEGVKNRPIYIVKEEINFK